MLEHLGYQVIVARSGKERWRSLRTARANRFDPAGHDHAQNERRGSTFDRLKEMDPAVRVILSSGYSIDGEARQILSRGCRGFINKPYTLHMLSEKIREALA
jgi:CheY-like chemotaxis protein